MIRHSPLATAPTRPELLAPAGDRTSLVAAIENGADAVYFGLQTHNARARAANFSLDELPEVLTLLHRRGVRGYVTFNTLIFTSELPGVETLIRRVAEAGVDALIVQDLGLCRLIRAITPDLEIHASTQMSVTSAEGVRLARELGCTRVILARELSLREIAKVRESADLPVEVFVHGALCVAYSGQCLTSEALGGRSANRGECAQACRLPYEMICDGRAVDLREVQYLLSPQDLAAFDLIPRLVELGVSSLKIEGRLKSPEYVANITRHYRQALDAACSGRPLTFSPLEIQDMEMSFSRGFSHGFLDGNDHGVLVRGDYAKKRGVFLGRVTSVSGPRIRLDLAAPVKPGDGVVFDADPSSEAPEQGGRVYEVRRPGRSSSSHAPVFTSGPADLSFGRHDLDPHRIAVGQRAWKTDDPELTKRLRASFTGRPQRRVPLDVTLCAVAGESLTLEARTATGLTASVSSDAPLSPADHRPATPESLHAQFDRLGDTVYELRTLIPTLSGSPLVPASLLNHLRRALIARLDALASMLPPRSIAEGPVLPALRSSFSGLGEDTPAPPSLSTLCRSTDQAVAAVATGVRTIYLDFHDIKGYASALSTLRDLAPDASLFLATPRIQKPGESPIFRYLAHQGADGLLVRNAGGLFYCSEHSIPFVADFSLNAANDLTAELLKDRGALRVTASYDLSFDQLDDLLGAVPPSWLEVVLHQHMPMFHMEFCAFSAHLSNGKPNPDCGRPCDRHHVQLRDRVGVEHPLKADVGCRNTLFNAVPQTAAEFLPRLILRGVGNLRIEFLEDDPASVTRILGLYWDAIQGRNDAKNLWRELKATNQYGVTRGQLAVLQ